MELGDVRPVTVDMVQRPAPVFTPTHDHSKSHVVRPVELDAISNGIDNHGKYDCRPRWTLMMRSLQSTQTSLPGGHGFFWGTMRNCDAYAMGNEDRLVVFGDIVEIIILIMIGQYCCRGAPVIM